MVCDEGYLPSSAGCTTCAPGYFPNLQVCSPCPATSAHAVLYGFAIVIFVVGVVAVAVAMVALAARKTGGSLIVGAVFLKDYVKWVMITWQTVVQVRAIWCGCLVWLFDVGVAMAIW